MAMAMECRMLLKVSNGSSVWHPLSNVATLSVNMTLNTSLRTPKYKYHKGLHGNVDVHARPVCTAFSFRLCQWKAKEKMMLGAAFIPDQ
jgi:hypothetical protein